MALEGTFKDFGLADIFQLVGLQRKTGVLTVRGEGGHLVTVSFERGMVVFAGEFQRTEAERLGSVLLRTRHLTPETLAKAMELQKSTSQRLGYILMDQRFITGEELRQALQLQVKETVYRLFRWPQGSYHFSPEPVSYDREIYMPLSAESVLMEGIRMIDEWPILERKIPNFHLVFERVPGAPAPAPAAAKPVQAEIEDLMSIVDDDLAGDTPLPAARGGAALGARENGLLALVDGSRTVQDLIDLGRLGEFETCKVLYGLISLGQIKERAGAGPAPPPSAVARAREKGPGHREYVVVAVAALIVLAAFLFNPWGIVAQGFRARQGRHAAAALVDTVRLRRVRLALEAYFLEKQSYPQTLDKLAESGLLAAREVRAGAGYFKYRAGERDYRLEREEGR